MAISALRMRLCECVQHSDTNAAAAADVDCGLRTLCKRYTLSPSSLDSLVLWPINISSFSSSTTICIMLVLIFWLMFNVPTFLFRLVYKLLFFFPPLLVWLDQDSLFHTIDEFHLIFETDSAPVFILSSYHLILMVCFLVWEIRLASAATARHAIFVWLCLMMMISRLLCASYAYNV